jgi:nucleoside-diphosphate-sugar epimerase
MRRLAAAGHGADVMSRNALGLPPPFRSVQVDLNDMKDWRAPKEARVISLVPIWILAESLQNFTDVQTIIAVSSTSRFGKAKSDDPVECDTAEKLASAEDILQNWCLKNGVSYTILRPTMIYDGQHDYNVARIATIIRRFGAFPIAAPGKGLRQPIHADDAAKAIMGALDNAAARGKALNIAGGEILTYRGMVEATFRAMGRKPRPLMLPEVLLRRGFQVAMQLGILHETMFSAAVFKRMNEDLVFDCNEGLELLGYAPRKFEPEVKSP